MKTAIPILKIKRGWWQIGLCVAVMLAAAALLTASGLSLDWGLGLLLLCPLIHLFVHRRMHSDQHTPQDGPISARAPRDERG